MTEALAARRVETVLLDAGGVLLDLDYAYVARLVRARGYDVQVEALGRSEAQARTEIHERVARGGRVGEAWRDYFHSILGRTGVPAAAQTPIIDSLWEAHLRVGLWTVPIDGSPAAVAELRRRGLRVGVVSNAEGRVATDLDGAGYAGLFDTVVDSHHVGVEKPDPAIFRIALERMGVAAETALFVGDVPAVDVVGAERAGLRAVLVDRHGLYADLPVPRVSALSELPGWLDTSGG